MNPGGAGGGGGGNIRNQTMESKGERNLLL